MTQVTPGTLLSTDQEPDAMKMPAPETVTVTSRKVACDGDDALGLGHPRVWLVIAPEQGFVDCPYCDKRFVLDAEHAQEDH
ncbi:zinc-finger domain-containing protein [Paracoccus sp. (in: a-proteobacteria)]|uniref:zinc-finger domain-containing protein n=1 Tax=Paracoccus sp. TaxID=267 RepID=UPI003A853D22